MKTKATNPQDAHDCGMDAEHCPLCRKRYGLESVMLAALEQVAMYARIGHDKPQDYGEIVAAAIAAAKGAWAMKTKTTKPQAAHTLKLIKAIERLARAAEETTENIQCFEGAARLDGAIDMARAAILAAKGA